MGPKGEKRPIPDLREVCGQITMLTGITKDILQKALEEESLEKVRDLLFEVNDRLVTIGGLSGSATTTEDTGRDA